MFKEAKFIYGLSCIKEPPAGEISGIGKLHKCLSDASYLRANKRIVLQYTKVSVSITNYRYKAPIELPERRISVS